MNPGLCPLSLSLSCSPFVSFLSDGFTRVVTHWAFSHTCDFEREGKGKVKERSWEKSVVNAAIRLE